MIVILAALVTRCVFPRDHQARQDQSGSRLAQLSVPAPPAGDALPGMRSPPPTLFPGQEALLALLTEVARRRLDGKEPEDEHDHD